MNPVNPTRVTSGPTHHASVRSVAANPSACPPISGSCLVAIRLPVGPFLPLPRRARGAVRGPTCPCGGGYPQFSPATQRLSQRPAASARGPRTFPRGPRRARLTAVNRPGVGELCARQRGVGRSETKCPPDGTPCMASCICRFHAAGTPSIAGTLDENGHEGFRILPYDGPMTSFRSARRFSKYWSAAADGRCLEDHAR